MDTEYLKKVGLYILTVLLSLGAIFYLGYHIWHTLTREVETAPVTEFTAENTVKCDAYIFRNESPLQRTTGGQSIVPSVREGEKVQAGSEVAKVYSGSAPGTVAEISDMEERIKLLESCVEGGTVSLKESGKLEEDIYAVLSGIRNASERGDVRTAQGLRTSLLTLLNKRSLLAGGTNGNFEAELAELRAKKESLGNPLGSYLESITAKQGGYYYSEADGYEEVFVASELENMSYDDLKNKLSASPKNAENTAGKTVTDSYWYAVCPLEKKYLETYKPGGSCTATFSGDVTLQMEVSRILSGNDGIILILRTNYLPRGFSFARTQKAELVTETCKGYKVPVGAVRMVNGTPGVYVLDGVTVRFRKIKTIHKTDSYYVAAPEPQKTGEEAVEEEVSVEEETYKWLRFHDNLIIEGKGLFDGRVVGK